MAISKTKTEEVVIEETNKESESKVKTITKKVTSNLSSAADFAAEGSSLLIDNISYTAIKAKIKLLSLMKREPKESLEDVPSNDEPVLVKDEDVAEVAEDIVVVPKFDKLKEEGKKTTSSKKSKNISKKK